MSDEAVYVKRPLDKFTLASDSLVAVSYDTNKHCAARTYKTWA